MAKVVGGMTLSLDGFGSDAHGDVSRLYPDLGELGNTGMLQEEIRTTGAVVMGRNSYDMGDPDSFADTYEYQVPIFVVTHHVPEKKPKENDALTITFVTDGVERAVEQASAAAGDKNVMLIGASVNQQCINAGLCDELHIGIMPVLLGDGLRLFEHIDAAADATFEKIRLFESGPRTDIWFRVVK
jgi:dihydrofolate reductase